MSALHILFVSADIGGNVPPTRAIADELARRGHRVTMAPIPSLAELDVRKKAGPLGHAPSLYRMAMGGSVSREVRAAIASHRPDAVVVDGVMLTSIREAIRSGTPTAVLFHSLGTFWSDGMGGGAVNLALRPRGLAPKTLLGAADALLLPTDRELDPASRESTPFAFEWLGTTERGVPPAPRAPGQSPLVLVSLSSAWQKRQGDVYRRIIAALAELADGDTPVRAIVTTGGVQLDGDVVAAANVEVRGYSPHAEIMPHAELVIGHGGHSTTLKALAHGVPLLVLPMDRTSDQPLIGRVVEEAGLGRTLSKRATPTQIADAVRGLLADGDIRGRAARTGERLRAEHGEVAGADRVEAIARPR